MEGQGELSKMSVCGGMDRLVQLAKAAEASIAGAGDQRHSLGCGYSQMLIGVVKRTPGSGARRERDGGVALDSAVAIDAHCVGDQLPGECYEFEGVGGLDGRFAERLEQGEQRAVDSWRLGQVEVRDAWIEEQEHKD